LQRSREFADYDAATLFSSEDASNELQSARSFEAAALELLRKEGLLEP
jgi:hypothetical protein